MQVLQNSFDVSYVYKNNYTVFTIPANMTNEHPSQSKYVLLEYLNENRNRYYYYDDRSYKLEILDSYGDKLPEKYGNITLRHEEYEILAE